jgi:predicted SAM-dependent methyltransferase
MALCLNIGGEERIPGYLTVNIRPGPDVDAVASFTDLSQWGSGTVSAVYASHVLEHLSRRDVLRSLSEVYRVLEPGGEVRIAVPDMHTLSRMVVRLADNADKQVFVLHMMMGGQTNVYDFHASAFTQPVLTKVLEGVGFVNVERVESFGLVDDCSTLVVFGDPVSLNVIARKPGGAK